MPYRAGRSRSHSTRGRFRGRSRYGRSQPRTDFKTSRLQDVEHDSDDVSVDSDDNYDVQNSLDQEQTQSSSDEEAAPIQSYADLLRSLKSKGHSVERPSKRRKLDSRTVENDVLTNGENTEDSAAVENQDDMDGDLAEQLEEEELVDGAEIDSEDEAIILQDPFEQHFSNPQEQHVASAMATSKQKRWRTKSTPLSTNTRKTTVFLEAYNSPPPTSKIVKSNTDLHLKKRLADVGQNVLKTAGVDESHYVADIFDYRDVALGLRTMKNTSQLRDTVCLHALNHIFKTRDRILKNNAKISHDVSDEGDFRDQGFTRSKVLFLLPTKQACVRFVESIVKISQPDQQENKSRLLDTFSQEDDATWDNKSEDFRELFGGNNDEDFRIGLKFTRKTIKFFSGFYNSDIILASPLGLMRTLTGGGNSKDDRKGGDSDFLSSIEVVIMDHTNALEMQNFQHVDYVFSQLNLLPKEAHGCDFSRARAWYLDGNARYFRQTIILSSYLTPTINNLVSNHLFNIAGRTKYARTYTGAISSLPAAMPIPVTQTFLRFESPSPVTDSDSRFKYFTASILPSILRHKSSSAKGTLVFIPTYADFVRMRNYFSTSNSTTSLTFGTLSEYSSMRDAARARSHFASGRHSVLLYTERAHHYFRYRIRGVKRIVFYGVPENPLFWEELIPLLALSNDDDGNGAEQAKSSNRQGKGLVRAMFSRWDGLKLERIVGTERVGRLVNEKEGDVFDFV